MSGPFVADVARSVALQLTELIKQYHETTAIVWIDDSLTSFIVALPRFLTIVC